MKISHQHEFLVLFFDLGAVVVPVKRFRVWVVEASFAHAFVAPSPEPQPLNCHALEIELKKR